jgi:hypothetical protein
MKSIALALVVTALSLSAYAKRDDKQTLIDSMAKNCKSELAKTPKLTDLTDGETVWKNLEDKEHSKVALSKDCEAAHEKYEAKYHKEDEKSEHTQIKQ